MLRRRGIVAVIPDPADQARRLRAQDYEGRNVVKRFFNRMEDWRGLASRYDKHALVFRGSVLLAAILDWLR